MREAHAVYYKQEWWLIRQGFVILDDEDKRG